MSGSWSGTWQFRNLVNGAGSLEGSFQQDGAKLTGNFNVTGPTRTGGVVNIVGFVQGHQVVLSQRASGTPTVNGDEMSGWINGLDPARVTLHKQK